MIVGIGVGTILMIVLVLLLILGPRIALGKKSRRACEKSRRGIGINPPPRFPRPPAPPPPLRPLQPQPPTIVITHGERMAEEVEAAKQLYGCGAISHDEFMDVIGEIKRRFNWPDKPDGEGWQPKSGLPPPDSKRTELPEESGGWKPKPTAQLIKELQDDNKKS